MKRLHLSTLLLLTVLAGAFIGLNMLERTGTVQTRVYVESKRGGSKEIEMPAIVKGWPIVYKASYEPEPAVYLDRINNLAFAISSLLALASLALAGYVSEKIIRRRKSA